MADLSLVIGNITHNHGLVQVLKTPNLGYGAGADSFVKVMREPLSVLSQELLCFSLGSIKMNRKTH